MSEFIKLGNRIVNKPNGLDYELVNGKVYNLKCDYSGTFLEEDGGLNLPKKLYNTPEDERFIDRVNTYFNNTDKLTTGVLLSGIKGTGKTVMAKMIARNSNLPVIVVDESFPTRRINDFFCKFTHPVAVIFDEIDKHWDTEDLLGWLDGVQINAKKLVLFTCNDDERVSSYLKNRCSRIRYVRHFEANSNARFLKEILADRGITEDKIEETYDFIINNFELLSIDNIISFIDEKIMFSELSNEEVMYDMNISPKGEKIISSTSKKDFREALSVNYDEDDEDYEDDDSDYEICECCSAA